jgi:hypothetical protein
VIVRTIFRALWVVTAFLAAAAVALVVLFALGAIWVGDELRAASPNDPLLKDGAPIFGLVLFAGTIGPALTALPGIVAVAAGDRGSITCWQAAHHWRSSRSWERPPRRTWQLSPTATS